MAQFGFVGPSYQSQSVNADAQMSMNWFPEIIESGMGKSAMALYPTPGLALQYTLGNDPVRGEISFNGRSFAVAGTELFELLSNGMVTSYPGLVNDGQPVSMVAGGAPGNSQILIQSGGNGYTFNTVANTLIQVPPAMQVGPWSAVYFIDGFFIAIIANSNEFQLSNLEDSTTWNLANVSQTSLFADNVISSLADHRELWLWSPTKAIVLYNSGDIFNPIQPVPGGFLEQGAIAPLASVRLDNSVFWLGGDERGAGIVWRAQGYSPMRVSNHAVEYAWQNYPTLSDAIAYAYQDAGHSFYVITFPTANATWVYDVATGQWHQRGFWQPNIGMFTAHRARFHTYGFGMHLVGDYTTGAVYSMSTNIYNDFGNPIRRVRRAPHISTEQEWSFHHQMQVDAETGLGAYALPGYVVADTSGQNWTISIDSFGGLHTTATNPGTPTTLFLNDPTRAASWQVKVTTAGLLQTTSVTLNVAYPTALLFPAQTASLNSWNLGVTLGGLLTTTNAGTVPLSPTATAPQFMLRWSDDGGHAWSNIYNVSAGNSGNYKARAIWRRLGRSRDRVYELSVSDNAAWRIVNAYLLATPGFTPTERLVKQLGKAA